MRDNARLLTDAMAMADIGAVLEIPTHGEPVRPGPKGAVGYCLGGRLRARRRRPHIPSDSAPPPACTARGW